MCWGVARNENIRVRVSGDQDIDVELACKGAERVEVARGEALVAVDDADADRRVRDGDGEREGTLQGVQLQSTA